MLRSLTRMPADLSSDSRRQLLNAVTDLFLLDDEPSEQAKEHYGDIAVRSLPHLDADNKRAYAGQVALAPSLPHEVALTLAGDEDASVARLVLKLSPVLTDPDLAAIAVSHSQSHLVAIAERVQLSETVTDILVERGGSDVLKTVSSNEGAHFSETGFDRLLSRGGKDADVTDALARRADLTPLRAERVLRIVEQMADAPAVPNSRITAGQSLARQARQQRLEVKLLLLDLAANERTLDDVLTMLADEDRAYHLAQVLAQAANLNTEQALRVLMQRDPSGLAVACKGLGVSSDAFRAIVTLRGRRIYFSPKDLDEAVDSYIKLDISTADRTMRFLRLRTKLG